MYPCRTGRPAARFSARSPHQSIEHQRRVPGREASTRSRRDRGGGGRSGGRATLTANAAPALVLYAAFGSSRHLVVGPMAATAALSAAAVADIASRTGADFTQLTVGLALVTGVVGLLAGLVRLGFVASFISEPVLKGFIIGLALTIMIGQLPKLLGIPKSDGDFFEQAWGLLDNLGETQGWTVLVGVASLAIVLGCRRFVPKVPGSLVAVLAGLFVIIGSLTVAGPVIFYLAATDKATGTLASAKEFLSDHNAVIMMMVLLVLGAKILGQGLGALGS